MVRWLNPNQGQMDEDSRRRKNAQDAFRERGLSHPSMEQFGEPGWRMETGHVMDVNLHPDGGWFLSAYHPGDPTGTTMHAHLGHDDESLYDSVHQVLRSREAMGHMTDMYHRAYLNNDPTGESPETRRDPRRYYRELHTPRVWVN